jgi:hypothetical protein
VAGRRAAPASCVAVALAACVCACGLAHERDMPPALVLSPGTALQGASLTVLLTAPGVQLSSCQDLSGASVEFRFGDDPSPIEVTTLETLDTDTLRARLVVSMEALPGDHLVVLHCDELTDLKGMFSVRERIEDAAITLDPQQVKAGSFYFQIDIFSDDIAFSEESTHVVFGDGTRVTVREQAIVDEMSQMFVRVDVDPLTPPTVDADGDAVGAPMAVAVITGDLVARGVIDILPRDTPWIEVVDDYIELTGTELPAQTTPTITGTGIAFVEPDPEADAGATEDVTVVTFPENPGLHVTSMNVDDLDPSVMEISVLAEQGAILGPTPLTVSTGGETVSAAFTVYPPGGGEAFLTLAPAHLPRGVSARTVVARGYATVPFTEGDPGADDLHFDEGGCHVEKLERLSESELAVDVSVDGDYEGDSCTLHVAASEQNLVARLAVVAPDAPVLSGFTSIAQGASYVWIEVASTEIDGVEPVVFDADTVAIAGARSGVDIWNQLPGPEGATLAIMLKKVADDAPVGEAVLHVLDDGADYHVEYSVIPSEETPSNVLVTPGSVIARRGEVSFGLESVDPSGGGSDEAMEFDAGAPPGIGFDDPAIRATSVDVIDSRNAIVNATVLPSVRADTAVMYVTSGEEKAAASVRVLTAPQDIVTAMDPEITRGDEDTIISVEAEVPAGAFQPGTIVGDVFADIGVDGIGVEVLSVVFYATLSHVVLELRVASDGPAGWFGVVITDGRRTAVLPLHVAGETDSLTMTVAPASVGGALRPGDVGVVVDALLPDVAPEGCLLPEARGAIAGVFVRLDALDGHAALLTVDVAADVAPAPEGIPIAVLTGSGAAVGFAPYVSTDIDEVLSEATPLDVFLDPELNPVVRVDADPAAPFSYAVVSSEIGRASCRERV